ncbi:MAG: hypothetical protein Tsb0013_13800 [Phycisphaerales bacterium]
MNRLMTVAGAAVALTPMTALANTSADEVRAIVAEMLADAETRSSLLQSGGSAGYDGGFVITDNANFSLKVNGIIQQRYTAFIQDDSPANDDYEGGFSIPRAKLIFSGHATDPNLVYRIQGEFGQTNNGGTFTLEEAYVGYNWDNGWGLYGGQVRLPVLWEDVVSEGGSLAADASVTNEVFSPQFSQAAWLHYSNEDFRGWLAFSDGANSGNTDFTNDPSDYAFTCRVEFNLAGDWSQFNTMSSAPGSDFAAKLGLGAHYQWGPNTPAGGEVEALPYTADLMLQGDGWNAYAAFIGRYVEIDGVAGDFNDYGLVLQGGVFIPETDWELFARYDAVFTDDNYANDGDFNTLTIGTNWYISGQNARFTFDVQYYFDATADSDPVNAVAAGSGPDVSLIPTVDDGAVALRAQFQLMF